MKKLQFLSLAALALCACQNQKIEREVEPLTPMSFEKVTLEDDFWLPRLKIQKETLVPFSLEKTRFSVENLRRVGQYLKGEKVTKLMNPSIELKKTAVDLLYDVGKYILDSYDCFEE